MTASFHLHPSSGQVWALARCLSFLSFRFSIVFPFLFLDLESWSWEISLRVRVLARAACPVIPHVQCARTNAYHLPPLPMSLALSRF